MTAERNPELSWVETHRAVVERAYLEFVTTGEWPKITELRRHFARLGQDVDVERSAREKPQLPGVLRPMYQENLVLLLRDLRYIPRASPLMWICVAATRRAVDAYLADDAEPKVSSSDPGIAIQTGSSDATLLMRAGKLLRDEPAGPLAGGSYSEDHWESPVNEHTVLDYRDAYSPDEFVVRQDAILDRALAAMPGSGRAPPSAVKRSAFVLMPFGPEWSQPVYELIRAATLGLDISPIPACLRADEITAPGRITDQIVAGIAEADVIVADISGVNPNVMWELGFAHALGKPVVILNQDIDACPFDLHDYRQTVYSYPPTGELVARLSATLRSSFLASGPDR